MTPISLTRRSSQPDRLLKPLCSVARLSAEEERSLFDKLLEIRSELNKQNGQSRSSARQSLVNQYHRLRNRIVAGNLRLVIPVARRFASAEMSLEELVTDGMLPLIQAAEAFDPSRGTRFSTYATHAVRNHFLRLRRRRAVRRQREQPTGNEFAEAVIADDAPAHHRLERDEQLQHMRSALANLPERDRYVIAARYGLGRFRRPRAFAEIGRLMGLSKERARVLTHRAMKTLRDNLDH